MSQQYKVGKTATTIKTDSYGITKITYHQTDVVSFNDSSIVLDTGGWKTATTKSRMNQASNQFNLGYQVFQKKGKWFVKYKNQIIRYYTDQDSLGYRCTLLTLDR